MTDKTPIILLAFANEKEDDSAYLRALATEQRLVKSQLQKLKDNGICEIEQLPNATLREIFDTFQNEANRNRICLFHYGGHASSFQLLLESEEGGNLSAHGESLMRFIGKQKENGLKALVLNGCATEKHAHQLSEMGIAVIATSQSINDEIATKFAERLYSGISNQIPLKQSFDEASDFIKSEKGTANKQVLYRDLAWDGMEDGPQNEFPWKLYLPAPLNKENDLASWTIKKSYDTLNLSDSAFATIEFQRLKDKGEIDVERINRGLTKLLIESANVRKSVAFLEKELPSDNSAIVKYIQKLKTEIAGLRKHSIKGEHDLAEKKKERLIRDIWETFS